MKIILSVQLVATLTLCLCSRTDAQVVINEVVYDERTATFGNVAPDTREFVELYNGGSQPVDLSNWQLRVVSLSSGTTQSYALPAGASIGPNDYFVLGASGVANVDYTPPGLGGTELFPDILGNQVFEVVTSSQVIVDALAVNVYRSPQLANYLDPAGLAQVGGGWWGQAASSNVPMPNLVYSLGRYIDGRDGDDNGRDFGVLPLTPGAANQLSSVANAVIPDVDALPNGSEITSLYGSFALPRVIDPTVADSVNMKPIPPSPQGGKAMIAWDPAGGGNVVYSKEYVRRFEISAYIETAPLGVVTDPTDVDWEQTIYGIGTSDPVFASFDSTGQIGLMQSPNGSTGLGWAIVRSEEIVQGIPKTRTMLQLIDMNDGGNSLPAAADWQVEFSLDLSDEPAGWRQLSIDYDPATGDVLAKVDGQSIVFQTSTDLIGTFYVGYREVVGNVPGSNIAAIRPPTFDLAIPEPSAVSLAALAVGALILRRRSGMR